MRKRAFACSLAVMLCLTACSKQSPPTEKTASFFAMDTYITFTAYGEKAEATLLQAKDKTNGALEPTIYPALTAWSLTAYLYL